MASLTLWLTSGWRESVTVFQLFFSLLIKTALKTERIERREFRGRNLDGKIRFQRMRTKRGTLVLLERKSPSCTS